jgi:predicted acyl esterase
VLKQRGSKSEVIGQLSKSVRAVALVGLLFAVGCGDGSNDTAPAHAGRDLSHALPAAFAAHGSVGQVYVTGADAGTTLELVNAANATVQSGTADAQGTLIFRKLTPAAGYAVISEAAGMLYASGRVTVTAEDAPPPADFYRNQHVGAGYGYIQTRDGTTLAINVYLPGPEDAGPYPTVIEYSGYDPANPDAPQPSTQIAGYLGYAAVGINMRGTGCSGGAFDYFEPLQSTDGYDAIEIVAAQPWVKNNKVGMVGLSYPGITQLFVARLQPPHLAAIAPLSVIADSARGTLYPGGILNNGFALDWARDRQHDAQPGGQPWSQKRIDAGDQTCIDNQRLRGQSPDILQMIAENQYYTAEVADPLAPVTFVDRINVPVFLAGSWQDEQVGPYFATMLDHFTGTDKLHFTLVNGTHVDPLGPEIFPRWFEFLSFYVDQKIPRFPDDARLVLLGLSAAIFGPARFNVEPNRFTDAATYAEALARYEAEPAVRILFDNGAGLAASPGFPVPAFEQSYARWPIPEVTPLIRYFADGGRLLPEPPAGDGADTYVYDPSGAQATTLSGSTEDSWKSLPQWNWQPLEDGKALAYATEPLPEDMLMAGSGSVDLWLQSTAADVDLQVTLSEIRPDGLEMYVQSGWLRASHRKPDAQRSTILRPLQTHLQADAAPLPAGQFVEARVELFPFAHAFRAGSRIRISVEAPGRDRPFWKFDALPANGEVINTIGHLAAAPSRVVLPLLSGAAVPAPLPPCPSLRGQPCRAYVAAANGG